MKFSEIIFIIITITLDQGHKLENFGANNYFHFLQVAYKTLNNLKNESLDCFERFWQQML